jgi:DNA-binding GntR family transcriptional regulator
MVVGVVPLEDRDSANKSASQRAYDSARAAIVSGRYPSGTPLREEELAEAAGVSRTPVREALRRLAAEGLVDIASRRGARVAEWTREDVEEIFALRAELEGSAARLAAKRATEVDCDRLRRLCDDMECALDDRPEDWLDRVNQANAGFHRGVLDASANARLASMVGSVTERTLVEKTFHLYDNAELYRSLRHHRELIDAIATRDPDWAEAAMRVHIYAGRDAARKGLR